jgi:hypothetical protein
MSYYFDMTNPTETRTVLVKCPRCGGSGILPQFRHIGGGECFECGGFGKVDAKVAQQSGDVADGAAFRARCSVDDLLACADCGRMDLVESRISRIVDDLFVAGTERARRILDEVSAGRYFDNETGRQRFIDADLAADLRRRIVARGFEVRAAA